MTTQAIVTSTDTETVIAPTPEETPEKKGRLLMQFIEYTNGNGNG